jgi:hypothetical protein
MGPCWGLQLGRGTEGLISAAWVRVLPPSVATVPRETLELSFLKWKGGHTNIRPWGLQEVIHTELLVLAWPV